MFQLSLARPFMLDTEVVKTDVTLAAIHWLNRLSTHGDMDGFDSDRMMG